MNTKRANERSILRFKMDELLEYVADAGGESEGNEVTVRELPNGLTVVAHRSTIYTIEEAIDRAIESDDLFRAYGLGRAQVKEWEFARNGKGVKCVDIALHGPFVPACTPREYAERLGETLYRAEITLGSLDCISIPRIYFGGCPPTIGFYEDRVLIWQFDEGYGFVPIPIDLQTSNFPSGGVHVRGFKTHFLNGVQQGKPEPCQILFPGETDSCGRKNWKIGGAHEFIIRSEHGQVYSEKGDDYFICAGSESALQDGLRAMRASMDG